MTKAQKAQAKIEKAAAEILAKLESGDLGEVVRKALIETPADWPATRWSFKNKLAALIQTGTLNVRGYKQWQAAGRQVAKGASMDASIWGPRLVDDPEREGEKILIGWYAIGLFSEKQLTDESRAAEANAYRPADSDLPALLPVAARLGLTVDYRPGAGDCFGSYSPDNRAIKLHTDHAATFYHELAHAVHDRIDGLGGWTEDRGDRAKYAANEAVAEFSAAVLMSVYEGADTSAYTADYIRRYADDGATAAETVRRMFVTIEKVLSTIAELAEAE